VAKHWLEEYGSLMVYAAYLLGHVDGTEGTVEEVAPKAVTSIEGHPYFKPFFGRLHEELRAMHSSYGRWQGLEVFEPLKNIAYDLLKACGMDVQTKPDGTGHVVLPFTPETTPSFAEQMAFLAARNSVGSSSPKP
jgi:hypothetical protein